MSWNIKTPGDYINGPLTVAGQQTLNNLLAIRGTPTFPTSGVGLELFYSPTNLNSNIYSYNRTTSGWAELVFGSSNTIFQINGVNKVVINSTGLNVGGAPNANSRAWALQGFGYINGGDGNGIEWRNSGTANSSYITNDGDRLNINFPAGVGLTQGNLRFANGNGIDFSLSPNAPGATSEILNDYEEGTWTGTLKGATTDPTTPVTGTGRYTKVGRQVYVEIIFGNVNTTGASGAVSVNGLPFLNNSSITSQGSLLSDQAITFTGSPFSFIEVAQSRIQIYQSNSNAPATTCPHNPGGGRYLYISQTYTVA